MKKITLIIYVTVFILLINNSISTAQTDRTPIYVHGLGETNSEWAQWRALFNGERRMQTGTNNSYISTDGIINFANRVPTPANNNTIIFGHSTGGVVARQLERTRSNPFGGIITAGAPMDGARVSNSLTNGQAANFIVDGVDKVLKGPIRELGVILGTIYEVAGHKFKSLAETEVNRILNQMQTSTTANNLAEGSAYMNNGHRTQNSTMPKIHIYGNENSPVLWRIASVAADLADGELVSATQQGYDVCIAAKIVRLGRAITQPWNAIHHIWVADGWNTSANWLSDGSERGWNDLIGASTPASRTTTSQVLDYNQLVACLDSYGGFVTTEQYMLCQEQSTTTVTYTYFSPVNGLSDGFIKAPSQTGYNSTWSNNATEIEALGVNHLEMNSHAVMLNVYNGIFDRTIFGVDQFFLTPRR